MKRLLSLALGVLLAMSFLSIAEAADNDSVYVYVTVTGVLAVDILETALDFGSVSADSTSVLSSSATVRNTSSGLTESYKIKGSNSSPSNWTIASAATGPGENRFVLYAAFHGSQPGDVDGTWSEDDLESTDQNCSDTVFTIDGTQKGTNVPANKPGNYTATGSDRGMWFRIKTPTSLSVGSGTAQTITVTVTAM